MDVEFKGDFSVFDYIPRNHNQLLIRARFYREDSDWNLDLKFVGVQYFSLPVDFSDFILIKSTEFPEGHDSSQYASNTVFYLKNDSHQFGFVIANQASYQKNLLSEDQSSLNRNYDALSQNQIDDISQKIKLGQTGADTLKSPNWNII